MAYLTETASLKRISVEPRETLVAVPSPGVVLTFQALSRPVVTPSLGERVDVPVALTGLAELPDLQWVTKIAITAPFAMTPLVTPGTSSANVILLLQRVLVIGRTSATAGRAEVVRGRQERALTGLAVVDRARQ